MIFSKEELRSYIQQDMARNHVEVGGAKIG